MTWLTTTAMDLANPPVPVATAGLPDPTGRDNAYHQYFATITPTPAFNGYVTVSVKQFSDKVIPVPNVYTPLSPQQVVATTLGEDPTMVRDARVLNESLMVEVAAVGKYLSRGGYGGIQGSSGDP